MSAALRRAAGPSILVVLCLLLAGCGGGFGGFGGDAPEVAPKDPIRNYVALGDGFAAAPYVGKTDRAQGCLRSTSNYPARVASRLGATLTDVTCTGAQTGDILNESRSPDGKATLPAQIDAVKPDTDLVTLTVGVSDKQLLYRGFYVCMAPPCGNKIPPQDIAAEAAEAAANATEIVRRILTIAPRATVVIVGYPWIAPHTNACDLLPKLNQAELDGANALFFSLNRELQTTARQTNGFFADLSEVSDGHDVCAADPWIRSTKAKDERAALHPLAPAVKAAADAVVTAVRQR